MRRAERFLLLAALVIALAAFLRIGNPSDAHAAYRQSNEHTIAVCAIPLIVNELMSSDRFLPAREALGARLEAEIQPLLDEAKAIYDSLQSAKQDDPETQSKLRRFQQLQQQVRERQQSASVEIERITANQIVECYKLVRSSAIAVAEDLGFDYVIASVGEDEDLTSESVEVVLRQMVARPVVLAPKDVDITEDVREDLKLE